VKIDKAVSVGKVIFERYMWWNGTRRCGARAMVRNRIETCLFIGDRRGSYNDSCIFIVERRKAVLISGRFVSGE
jgi:hypothetical protein